MVGRLTMDCIKIEQMLPAYTLGSLANSETVDFTAHIDACASCAVKVREAGDTLVNLARMVPQKRPSTHVKERLFASIEQENQPKEEPPRTWMGVVRSLGHQLALSPGTSLAVVFLVVAVVVGYWSSRSLQDLQDLRSDIDHRMESVAKQEQDLREGLEQQHKLFETIATGPRRDGQATLCEHTDSALTWPRVSFRRPHPIGEGKYGYSRPYAPASVAPESVLPRLAHQARRAGDQDRDADRRFDGRGPCRNRH